MEDLYHSVIWVASANPVLKRLTEARQQIAQGTRYGVEDFEAMLREVLGGDDILTDDEKFLRYIDNAL